VHRATTVAVEKQGVLHFFFQFFTVHIVTIHTYSPTHAHFLNYTIKL